MAVFSTTRPLTSGQVSAGRITKALFNVFAAVSAWNDMRVTRNSLAKLSDRELDDIGLSRGDIDHLSATHIHR